MTAVRTRSADLLPSARDVLSFWIDEVGEARWYRSDEALDGAIRDRFGPLWEQAMAGGLGTWLTSPEEALAYLILTDQFPRNMFRGHADAYASDPLARSAAKAAIARGWDRRVEPPERQFFYLPLMHSENLNDQDRCVRLVMLGMPEGGGDTLLHALAHREQIRRFGRFPARNAALGRETTAEEKDFLAEGGQYGLYERIRDARAG
jgi:uncharacterized protein (DUF924 family)